MRQLALPIAVLAWLLVVGWSAARAAQVCDARAPAATPTERFHDNGNGTVSDLETGLTWMRCPIGQRWRDGTCTVAAYTHSMHSWAFALKDAERVEFALHDDWRVPTIDELRTVVETRCKDPSINLEVFPATPSWYFWSSSSFADNPEYAWRVDFASGRANADLKSSASYAVRLVRGTFRDPRAGREPAPAPAAPAPDPLATDGIHDPTNPGLSVLQRPTEALAGFPVSRTGDIDWMQALDIGLIDPRAERGARGDMATMDFNIIMTNTKDMPHVRFPHLAHTRWLACSNCHPRIFQPKVGGNAISMGLILLGQYCGRCHGQVAFPVLQCERCHSVPHEGSPAKWW